MQGETELNLLLSNMTASLAKDIFVFATLPDRRAPSGIASRMVFEEAEGTTLIVTRDSANAFGLPYEFPCRMITLSIHSSLEAVGFISRIAKTLADEGMGVNPVAGFFHDHLFVPEGREHDAMRALEKLSVSAQRIGTS